MPTLVSPGVSVSITNESFFFPATAPTVPVFFIATQSGKNQADGVTPASGTLEHNVVRTVTSVAQALELYGIPSFRRDNDGNEFHGDARNEYGLLALNQYLGTGSRAYVVRADLDLTDVPFSYLSLGTPVLVSGSTIYDGNGNGTLASISATNSQVRPQRFTINFVTGGSFTVTGSVSGYIGTGVVGTPYSSSIVNFTITAGSVAFVAGDMFAFTMGYTSAVSGSGNGKMNLLVPDVLAVPEVWTILFTSPTAFSVTGSVTGTSSPGVINTGYDNDYLSFTITSGSTPFVSGDSFTITATRVTIATPLGANDATRRTTIVTALQAAINGNQDLRSELYEFNLVACPGYPECVDELVALTVDVKSEAVVIGDTPSNKTAEQIASWALSSSRVANENVAYYYPWCLQSNIDGRNVLGAPSGVALRTIAFSDQNGYVWSAPAGVSRGVVTGVAKVGYVSGVLGTATTFIESNLNAGQRDNLYEYYKNLNPIVSFPGRGILIWGQKTSAPGASALDRLNVARLVAYLRRSLRKGAMPFVFEPNDQITRDNLKAAADGMLNDVMSKRGLYDFATKCDKSNNTATRIDANELWLDVAIKPVRAAEFVYIPIRVVATSASI